MTFRDLIVISLGNLWRMKLRSILTISGIVIAMAAFVSMLSFGAGSQENLSRQFEELGLLTTIQVYPKGSPTPTDTSSHTKLDIAAIEKLNEIPGVNLAYPYDAVPVNVAIGDTVLSTKAQALPAAAIRTRLFSRLKSGGTFSSDSARTVLVSADLLESAGIQHPDSMVGKQIVVSTSVSVVDSGFSHILVDQNVTILDRLKKIHFDSLLNSAYRRRIIRTEVNETVRRFVNGFMTARRVISDTLEVCGVREPGRMGRARTEPVILPIRTAMRFKSGGLGGGPAEMFASIASGNLFPDVSGDQGTTFSQATVDFDPHVPYTAINDSIEALGFRTFSFAAEFKEIQKAFIYFDLALGLVGLIALFTASLGIVNTMVMSITERRREIGILKSLGAHEQDIRILFLVESAIFGFLGAAGGILAGWTITRVAAAVVRHYMLEEGITPIDPFSLPIWLIAISLATGIFVSIVAGFYPAARAARVDPVEALRNE